MKTLLLPCALNTNRRTDNLECDVVANRVYVGAISTDSSAQNDIALTP
jgi:hypothetical protein